IQLLQRRARRSQCADLLAAVLLGDAPEALRHPMQGAFPVGLGPDAVLANHRLEQAIFAVYALIAETIAIGEPDLVNRLILPRHDAHDASAQHMRVHVRAEAVMRRNQRMLSHLPGARPVAERLVVERTDRAKVDDVSRQLVIDALLDVRSDLGRLGAANGAEFLEALDFLCEAHTTRAVDAARHVGGDERTDILVLHDPLALGVARNVAAEAEGEILQLALAALIADGAIERMVDEQELQDRLLRTDRFRRAGEDFHAFGHRSGAGGQRLGRFLDLHEAHAAVGCDAELLVIAEARHVDVIGVRDLDHHLTLAGLHGLAVDFDIDLIVAHAVQKQLAVGDWRLDAEAAAKRLRVQAAHALRRA